MSENSRKKRLPIAVLAAPALAFGSIAFAAPAAVAVPEDEVEQILNDDVESLENGSLIEDEFTDLADPTVVEELENDASEETVAPAEAHDSESPLDTQVPADAAVETPEPAALNETALDPQIDIEGEWNNIRPGHTVTISGTGFTPDSEVTLTLNDEIFATTTADPEGAITLSEQIPLDMSDLIPWQFEDFELVATDSDSGESDTYLLTLYWYFDRLVPEISADRTEAAIGDTVRITVDNADELLATHVSESDDFEIEMQGTVEREDGNRDGILAADIERVMDANHPFTFEYTIPASIEAFDGTVSVRPGTYLDFFATLIVNPEDASPDYHTSWSVFVDIVDEETSEETPGNEETPGDNETPGEEETPADDETSEAPETVEPALTLEQDEILVEDFVGDAEEGTGVLHRVVGAAPGSTVEYAVETPATIAPFDSSDDADEDGVLEFWIHGYDTANLSVYLGEYTTTATFEDVDGTTQELSATFTVVDGIDGDGTEDEDDEIVPVVNTEDDQNVPADDDNDAPTVGSAAQLADTGASGAQLAWIAGGLLALGGAFVIFANRARLFGRKH